jgi:hypothetical protein
MDFEQETGLREADRRYAHLARQRQAGGISEEDFEAQRQRLMVPDGEARGWSKYPEGDGSHLRDGNAWVSGRPPAYREAAPEFMTSQTQAPGAKGGPCDDHPTGVWYDGERRRWAIFGQGREAVPHRLRRVRLGRTSQIAA